MTSTIYWGRILFWAQFWAYFGKKICNLAKFHCYKWPKLKTQSSHLITLFNIDQASRSQREGIFMMLIPSPIFFIVIIAEMCLSSDSKRIFFTFWSEILIKNDKKWIVHFEGFVLNTVHFVPLIISIGAVKNNWVAVIQFDAKGLDSNRRRQDPILKRKRVNLHFTLINHSYWLINFERKMYLCKIIR